MAAASQRTCVVIGRTRHKMMQTEIHEAARRGARLIELRLDFLAKSPDFKRLLANKPCPMICTVRRPEDGGRWSGDEEARQMLLRQASVAGFDWLDLETDIIDKIPRYPATIKRIVSYHNLREMPADLEKIYEKMCQQDADVVKIAVRAEQVTDNLRVLALVAKSGKPTVAFCVGDLGMPSRILCLRYGAPFTYAAFNKDRGIAPGLPSFEELKHVYRIDRIDADTLVYGVIGDPVGHSLSPLVHNAVFRSQRINAVYVPFRVPRGELEVFLKDFDVLPVRGYSVTIPHKEAAAIAAHVRDSSVSLTQAANTLIRVGAGFTAYNTDYTAAIDSLLGSMPMQHDGSPPTLQSRAMLLLGAGGSARAVAHALQREGSLVTIASRTYDRSQRLAEEIGCRAVEWHARHNVLADGVINCTPVGMHPNVDESPLHPSYLKPGLIVFDIIYTPETTLLVKEARSRGCLVVTGVDMFARQAAAQFRLFTGQEPPLDFMRTILRRALSPVSLKGPEELKK